MVMFNRSLRAVFRKESWMFCAGLLLSIADLLRFFELQHANLPGPQSSGQVHRNSMFLAAFPHWSSALGTRGVSLPLRRHGFPRLRRLADSCEYHTASPRAFQPGICGNWFSFTA